MSPSGAEYIKRIREQVQEVDPSDVKPLVGNGVPIIDVREAEEYAVAHLPGAKHVARGYLESRIDTAVPDRKQRVILYCATGQRSALAAHTLKTELGFEDVVSMTGGITLWKDRGYEVEVPQTLTAE
jgi:sulfur-carrier protein adenylyltransferase/sulfurtransferase